jgi:hypothetical protein
MTVDEDRMHLRTRLEELVVVSGAEYLIDRPPGGWTDLLTASALDLRLEAFEARFDTKLANLEHGIDLRFAGVDLRFAGVEARFDQIDARFDRFEHELLGQVDRRLRSQAWMSISTIVAVGAVILAAIRL